MKAFLRTCAVLLLALTVFEAWAEVRLPQIFGSHMVLQRRKPIPVWGWAAAGEKVTVQFIGAGPQRQTKTAKADKDGKWLIRLDPTEAGGPYQLVVAGKKNTLTLDDVLVGEVWICSGQSNMEMLVNRSAKAEEEKKAANFPQIRHFKVPHDKSLTPKDDVTGGEWQATTPETVGNFSAVAYFFAREIYNRMQVPIGLLNTSWGGTQVESWISREAMNSFDEFKEPLASMPVSLEELSKSRKKKLDEVIIQQQGGFPDAETVQSWSGASLDDSNWQTMAVPGYFDLKILSGLDGVVWVRKEFTLPAEWAGQSMVLNLCSIDDFDRTYVNGVKVGESTKKVPEGRTYIIPPNVLKAGKNVIAVRIEDLGSIGGFSGKAEQLKITRDSYEQPLAGDWKYRVETSVDNNQFTGANVAGTILYNAMVAPLIPFAMQGVIWYQGESNAGRAYQYRKSFPLLINDWRKRWGEDFPFLFVQLASYGANGGTSEKGSTWAELREAQAMTLTTVPNTGMAVTSDIGETNDIHPKNKQDVGKRLAYSALKTVYQQSVLPGGPVYQSQQISGNKVTLTFGQTGSGLTASDKYAYLKGFEVAGSDQKFHWAKAEIQGDKVVVWCDQVSQPVAVRYGWSDDNIEANLYNKEGFPAAPFRTDTWKGITAETRFK
ncbi:sialate O-acetylesterase [Larkinella rosea]|uniref:Sialate O-acetylesterase n=1 Tax=Larkinella rosea TaxID=2025312 RepID=A0A3P1BTH1_9BACT|nr:sialate O-acetylesterase [Larkinella rosea]RRB04401.1 sialate O-acetylesterase [Larkinella rosea]